MKKLFFLGALFAVGLGFTACSSDKDEVAETNILDKFDANGQAYISLNINLPTTRAGVTRAENDIFDDGAAAEYTVVNANSLFIIFSGASEADATIKSAYTLNPSSGKDWAMDGINAITEKAITQAIKKDGIGASDKIYALVVLNAQSLLKADVNNILRDEADNDLTGKTLSQLNSAITAKLTTAKLNNANFIMTNAPMTNRASGSTGTATCTTLSLIDKSKFFATAAEAEASPAANVYVERMAAKVTVNGTASGTLTADGTTAYTIQGWMLDNLNPSSNLTRVFDVAWIDYRSVDANDANYMPYRMTSTYEIESGAGLFRTYWATSKANTLEGKTTTGNFDTGKMALGANAYCCENTTTVANMTEVNSTRLIFGVQFNSGNPFYTISLQGTDEMYTQANAIKYVWAYLAGQSAVQSWFTEYFDSGNLATVIELATVTLGYSGDPSNINNISASLDASGISTYTFKTGKDAAGAAAAFNALTPVTSLNSAFTMKYYAGGIAYYAAFIEHFGDTYTPWPDTEGKTTTLVYTNSGTKSEVTSEVRYLGRWGVVRNNWYVITVSGISHIGEPTIPDLTTTPLDQTKSYLALKIAVTPWAKRTQTVNL